MFNRFSTDGKNLIAALTLLTLTTTTFAADRTELKQNLESYCRIQSDLQREFIVSQTKRLASIEAMASDSMTEDIIKALTRIQTERSKVNSEKKILDDKQLRASTWEEKRSLDAPLHEVSKRAQKLAYEERQVLGQILNSVAVKLRLEENRNSDFTLDSMENYSEFGDISQSAGWFEGPQLRKVRVSISVKDPSQKIIYVSRSLSGGLFANGAVGSLVPMWNSTAHPKITGICLVYNKNGLPAYQVGLDDGYADKDSKTYRGDLEALIVDSHKICAGRIERVIERLNQELEN